MGANRIAFCGASGTGKTTLTLWLSEAFGLPTNPVGSRTVAREMGYENPYDVDRAGLRAEFQNRLQAAKIRWEDRTREFVTDRTTLDELVYTTMHAVTAVDAVYLSRAVTHLARYDLVVYCPVRAFHEVADDPCRVPDRTYHEVFDVVLEGMLTRWVDAARLLRLDDPSLDARRTALARAVSPPERASE